MMKIVRNKHKSRQSLLVKIITIFTLLIIIYWGVSTFITSSYLKNSLRSEFITSNSQIIKTLGRQITNDIRFADFIQISRTLRDTFDEEYMLYLAVYTHDLKPLATYPTQMPGELSIFIEQTIPSKIENIKSRLPYKYGGVEHIHLQEPIHDESGKVLGYIALGVSTAKLSKTVLKQTISFTILGLLLLIIQILALIYFSNIMTRPFRILTKSLMDAENKQPEEIIPTLIEQEPQPSASSEVHVFYKVYRHLLQEIQKHQENAKQMAVQAAIGSVAAHIAHDVRSPLSVIKSALDPNFVDDPDRKLLVKTGLSSANKLDLMADDLLDYSRARQIEKRSANITKTAHEIAHEIDEMAKHEGKNIKIGVNSNDQIYANIDINRISRVLTNILTNAVQAIKHKDGKIDLLINAQERDLEIKVKDNGEGISDEHMPLLFSSTFTFGKKGGTGLGLSYCKNVVEAHGGTISAESRLGNGATFSINIPDVIILSPESIVEEDTKEEVVRTKITSDKKILVMDDEEEILISWRVLLKEATGKKPTEISDPEKLLESNIGANNIDIAIVDYEFRGSNLNGLDILEYLKNKGIKDLYLCTAYYQDKEIKEKAAKLGVKRIIPKPIPDGIINEIIG